MRSADSSKLTRRAVLLRGTWLGGLAVGLSACRKPSRHTAAPPDPDAAALSAAVESELRLVQMYDAAMATDRGVIGWLSAARDAHKAHLDALTNAPQSISPVSPSAGLGAELSALTAKEGGSAARLRAAAVGLHDS